MRRCIGPWKGYLGLVGFHLAVSLAFIVIFAYVFDYSAFIVPLHLFLVGGLIVLMTLAFGGLISSGRFRVWRMAPYVIGGSAGLLFLLLANVAILDFIANAGWGTNVSWNTITRYLIPDWFSIAGALPFYVRWLYGPLFTFWAATLLTYVLLSKRLMRALEEMFLPSRPFSLFRDRRTARTSLRVLLMMGVAWIVLIVAAVHLPSRFWRGEPILGLFSPETTLGEGPQRADIAEADRRIRDAYPKGLPFSRRNVIILMADSLRADHMQVYGYARPTTPFLSRLAETGRLRKVAFAASTCSETVCGVLSTLASRECVHLAGYNFKLHDLLRDQGYNIYFLLAGDHTVFHSEYREALGDNIDMFYDGMVSTRYACSDDRLLLEGLEQLPDYGGTPSFFFFFLMSTHMIGVKDEAFNRFTPSRLGAMGIAYVYSGGLHCQEMINRYDNSILQVDAFLESIFTRLEQKGYLDNALVLILADHGLGLGERGNYSHTVYLYQEDILIPFLIYDNPDAVYANLEFAMQQDVAPTIVDRLGLPIPSCWEGHSLLTDNTRRYSFHTTLRNDAWRAVLYRSDRQIYKYLRYSTKDAPLAREALYELTSDPDEAKDLLYVADPTLVEDLRARMAAMFAVPAK